MLGTHLTRQMLNKALFGIHSGLPQFPMPYSRSRTDVDIPLCELTCPQIQLIEFQCHQIDGW